MLQLKKGVLIAIEGIDGAGKTTVIDNLGACLANLGIDHAFTSESVGTPYAVAMMALFKNSVTKSIDHTAQALLVNSARRDVYQKVTLPALEENKVVIYDRFYLSTKAYQNTADSLRTLHDISVGNVMPDLTIILDLPLEQARLRLIDRNPNIPIDHLENVSIKEMEKRHEVMLNWYYKNESRAEMVSAIGTKQEVLDRVVNAIERFIEKYVVSRH